MDLTGLMLLVRWADKDMAQLEAAIKQRVSSTQRLQPSQLVLAA